MLCRHSLLGQILSLIPRPQFARHARDMKDGHYAKGFRAWDQFVAVLFCPLSQAKSLRKITGGLKTCLGKLNHIGMQRAPARSTLAYTNAHRH